MPVEEKPAPFAADHVLTHRRLLGTRIYLHTWVRLLVAATIALGAVFARFVLRVEDLDTAPLLVLALVIASYNSVCWRLTREYRGADLVPAAYRRMLAITYGAIVLDFLTLTVAVWLVGGARSPFLAFYLLHVILGCVYLSRRAAIGFALLAYALLAMLVAGEWSGLVPPRCPEGVVGGTGEIEGRFVLTILVVYGMLLALVTFLLSGLTRQVRQAERRIWLANAELERQADRRRDYLQIALHNLKAPIGAASMFLKNIRDGHGGDVTEKQTEWLERSLKRLEGLSGFMRSLLTLSSLDETMIRERVTDLDVGHVLEALVEDHRDVAREKELSLELELPRPLPEVSGIEPLVREAVVNYLTNAVELTPAGGRIVVRARAAGQAVRIEVEDTGPGVADDDREKLFEEFVRLPRRGSREVGESTGLGLSIVKRVADALGGACGVESRPGEGSTFWLDLPVC
jgi:signal transduction histidine kinase